VGRSKKGQKKTDFPETGSFIRLTREMLTSSAWQNLSDKERLGYINIKFNHFGDNAKEIKCPRRSLVHKMAPATWTKVVAKLVTHGFIKIIHQGYGYARIPTTYGLSNDWRRWKPGTDYS